MTFGHRPWFVFLFSWLIGFVWLGRELVQRLRDWAGYGEINKFPLEVSTVFWYVDNDAGSDASPNPNNSATPLKTLEEWRIRFPKFGNGSIAVVLLKPRAGGATYKKKDGVTDDNLDVRSVYGYSRLIIRGSSTFANDTADKLTLGAQVASAGPNGDGSWTVAAGATATTFSVAAGALPAEPGILLMRVRFKGNITAGLLNQCRTIYLNTAGAITVATDLSAAPAAGDEFFVEKPGVVVGQVFLGAANTINSLGGSSKDGPQIAGILAANTGSSAVSVFSCPTSDVALAFCQAAGGWNVRTIFRFSILPSYNDEGGTLRFVGGNRSPTLMSIINVVFLAVTESGGLASALGLSGRQCLQYDIQTTVSGAVLLDSNAANVPFGGTGTAHGSFGNVGSGTSRRNRVIMTGAGTFGGGIVCQGSNGELRGFSVEGCTSPCVLLNATGMAVRINDAVNGAAGGNTDVGIDMTVARGCKVVAGDLAANTISGTAGEIRFPGPALSTHAGLSQTNVVDNQGNDLVGTGGKLVAACILVTNKQGGGTALAIGDVVKSNGTTGQVVKAQATTNAEAASVLGVMVTPPADNAVGYMATADSPVANFDGAPTVGAIAYLSPGTAGDLTTTVPAAAGTNQKNRCGRVISVSGTTGRVTWHPDSLAVAADGAP